MDPRRIIKELTLHPTHQCFDDAGSELIRIFSQSGDPHAARLVHGIRDIDGNRSAHAWIEMDGDVIDCAYFERDGVRDERRSYYRLPCEEFYAIQFVVETVAYTVAEAIALSTLSEMGGPWRAPFLDFVSDTPTLPPEWLRLAEKFGQRWRKK